MCVIDWLCDGGFKLNLKVVCIEVVARSVTDLLQDAHSVASLGSCHIRSASGCQVLTAAVLGVVKSTSGRIDCTESLKPELFVRSVFPFRVRSFSFCSPGTQSRISPHAASTVLALCALSHSLACWELVTLDYVLSVFFLSE